jgi:L-lactate dehydrogenase (cytochrome)
VLSTAEALPAIVDQVGDRLEVLADGGIRSGLDILRMLALGARAVLLGRAWAWALAAGGERGIARMLAIVEAEMRVGMALTGVIDLRSIDRSLLVAEGRRTRAL